MTTKGDVEACDVESAFLLWHAKKLASIREILSNQLQEVGGQQQQLRPDRFGR